MIEDLHSHIGKSMVEDISLKKLFNFIKDLTDDIHHWYHSKNIKYPMISKDCSGIFVHDSIVVLKKDKVYRPTHSKIG